MHLGLETKLQVLEIGPVDRLVTVRVAGQKHILGQTAASQIIVRKLKGVE
jgi:Fe2+ transport system protein FeoA